jgi:hypothetical protein
MHSHELKQSVRNMVVTIVENLYARSGLLHSYYPVISDLQYTTEVVDKLIMSSIELAEMQATINRTNIMQEMENAIIQSLYIMAAIYVSKDTEGRRFAVLTPDAQQEVHNWINIANQLKALLDRFAMDKANGHVAIDAYAPVTLPGTMGGVTRRSKWSSGRGRTVDTDSNNPQVTKIHGGNEVITHAPAPNRSRYRSRRVYGESGTVVKETELADTLANKPVNVENYRHRPVKGDIHIYDSLEFTSKYRMSGNYLLQSIVPRDPAMKASDHTFGMTFVERPTVKQQPVDFLGVYKNENMESILSEIGSVENDFTTTPLVTTDDIIVATSRHHADVIFRGELVTLNKTLDEGSSWQYYFQEISMPYHALDKEQFDKTMRETGLIRIVDNVELSKFSSLTQLAATLREIGAAKDHILNQRIVNIVNTNLTNEINHFLKYHLNYECSIDSFADDWDECIALLQKHQAEDWEYIEDRLYGRKGWSSYVELIVERALNVMVGKDVPNEAAAFYNKFIISTKKHLQNCALYKSSTYLVAHLPVMSFQLNIEFDKQSKGLLSREYAPDFYDMVDRIYSDRAPDPHFNNLVVLVTNDDVEIEVDITSILSHREADMDKNKYLLTIK